jgi:hypothetical protein
MTGTETDKRLQTNKKYQAQLGWKRAVSLKYREMIQQFIDNNFNYKLPDTRRAWKATINNPNIDNRDETAFLIEENYGPIVKAYYSFADMGLTVAALFENNGKVETYAMGHLFSKHRMDPVWNWRKSQLIRNIYKKYLLNHPEIISDFHPVHVVLTLPHKDGLYKGKPFYAAELLSHFHELRRRPWWKKRVYAGEYGIETKPGDEGLHIHIHSFVLLKMKSVKAFQEDLKKDWEKISGGTITWAETLFVYKKDSDGKFIMHLKTIKGEKKLVRKKFYVDSEAREINNRPDLTPEQKKEAVIQVYLHGILECIKYHFKGDDIFNDIDLVNYILENTAGKRLYSRFGAFYKETELNFNKYKDSDENIQAEATETAINPYTGTETDSTAANLVTFYPNMQRRQPKTAAEPYALINNKQREIYNEVPSGMTVKKFLSDYMTKKFSKKTKPAQLEPEPEFFTLADVDEYDFTEETEFEILEPSF